MTHTPSAATIALMAFTALATIAAIAHAPAVLCVLFGVSLAVSLSDGRKFKPPHR